MRVTLLTVVVALSAVTIHLSAAADPECIYRQIRSLPMHWANPADCGRFYRCTSKNVKREVVCTGSKEYNPKTGKCANAGRGYCKLSLAAPITGEDNICANEVSGAFVAQEDQCRNFYICNENLAFPQSCDEGSTFNTTTASCVPDADNECWQNFCLKQPNGAYLADPTSCRTFYICDAAEAVAQTCDAGSYFNQSTSNCRPDEKNDICWENFCLTAADGALVKNPVDCHGFYSCHNKVATPEECPNGSYFDWQAKTCRPGECPDDETTTPADCEPTTAAPCESCTCPGGYKEGQLLPYPGNCMYYYICLNGALAQSSCREGNYFNQTLEVCLPDTEGVCPECSRSYRRARRSVEVESLPQPSCLDRYAEGQMLPHDECNKYQICFEGQLHTRECGVGSYFNDELKVCMRDEDNICKTHKDTRPTCLDRYFEGEIVAHDECNKYQICVDGQMQVQECGLGNFFNGELKACFVDEENICKPKDERAQEIIAAIEPVNSVSTCNEQNTSNCTCPGGYQPGQIICHPTDCDKFYVCENGQLVLHECGQGNMFSSSEGACVCDTENVCWPKEPDCGGTEPNICLGQANGELLPATQCNSFYQCVNGVAQPGTCSPGEWFDPTKKACEEDVNAVCINPCANVTGILFLPHPDCSKFYFCNDGQAHVEDCIEGGFNIEFGVCTTNTTCEASMCKNMADGTTFPVAGDKTKFYVCLSGVASIRDCETNSAYDEQIGVCLISPSSNCNQTICAPGDVLGAFPTLDGTENAFCSCRGKDAFESFCPQDYVFNAALGICYSNAPCDAEICQEEPEYTVSLNRNDTKSFCLCVTKVPVIVECPKNGTFYPKSLLCRGPVTQDPNCNPNFCLDQPDYTTAPALTNADGFCVCLDGGSTYHSCIDNYTFNPSVGICLPSTTEYSCNVTECASGTNTVFPSYNNPHTFCYCQNSTSVELRNCPAGSKFSPSQLVCLPDFCDETRCKNSSNQDEPYPAIDFPYGYCMCNGTNAVLHDCEPGTIFDPVHLVCTDEVNLECDISKCQVPGKPYPYDTPAINDAYSFCYCINETEVFLVHCPLGKIYNSELGICQDTNVTPPPTECDECTCPGGYPAGTLLPHPQYCSQYYICSSGVLQLQNCGTGNFFNGSLGVCQPNTNGACTDNLSPCTCVGTYREGETIANPTNRNTYYRCLNAQLHQETCTAGYYFDAQQGVCATDSKTFWHYRPRSAMPQEVPASTEDFFCRDNSKRSVSSNCSQYEICQDEQWRRRTCPHQRYYNPEEKKCLEPRDDTICNYAKVSGLPECNNLIEQQTLPYKYASNCALYYRCARGKWRLKSCRKHEYYSRSMRTCMPTIIENICQARNASETAIHAATLGQFSAMNCRHTAVRPLAASCAQYLMCLEGEWWHQYCPLGMYFNSTLNYCMPGDHSRCGLISGSKAEFTEESELINSNCTHDGELRPSASACNSYFLCKAGEWHQQTCGKAGFYYNATSKACEADTGGFCEKMQSACRQQGERREFPLNCTAFEVCENGIWQRRSCERNWTYDIVLQQCVPNAGNLCSTNGLRKSCRSGEIRPWPLAHNCTQFLYCESDSWQHGVCLKGHTYAVDLRTCVPHVPEDRCRPMWNTSDNLTVLPFEPSTGADVKDIEEMQLPGNDNVCRDQEDGTAVPHPTDCSRFYLCLRNMPGKEQQCSIGSFFDASLKYCRPNDGSCSVPLLGACTNASNGDLVPNFENCRSYYQCSTINGTQLLYCPAGQYFHKQSQQCRVDYGECREQHVQHKCTALSAHGNRLPHERYCNIYYACVQGLAIPVECANGQQFNPVLGRCLDDDKQNCLNGELINKNQTTWSCGNLTDGTYIPNRSDCTRYYICSNGRAQPKRCAAGAYFDSEQLLCLPDNGTCAFVDAEPNEKPTPPEPLICEGKHGNMLPDPANCNEFYVCINGKLKHERCYAGYFFNATIHQCQSFASDNGGNATTKEVEAATETTSPTESSEIIKISGNQQKCTDKATNFTDLCAEMHAGASIAEQGDCRRYISCQDKEPAAQRCRNGESYDSLLGFCRQNDGTCLLENGQRVGECNRRHGQLTRDTENCRGYFVCINGQKIPGECAEHEYFDKMTNMCQNDASMQCSSSPKKATTAEPSVSCKGLSEAVLYPYIHDHCRSYFQCVKGAPKVFECADSLYFDANSTRCVKEIQECTMPTSATTQSLVRAPEVTTDLPTKHRCKGAVLGKPYANLDDHCQSYYVCDGPDSIGYTNCPEGTLYSTDKRACAVAEYVVCKI